MFQKALKIRQINLQHNSLVEDVKLTEFLQSFARTVCKNEKLFVTQKKISSNQLLRDFFSKNVAFTEKIKRKKITVIYGSVTDFEQKFREINRKSNTEN